MEREPKIVTSVHIDPNIRLALRRLAELRAAKNGGRFSVSGVIEDLVAAEVARTQAEPRG